MRRGERRLWRELRDAAAKVAASSNHAEEYMARVEFNRIVERLAKRRQPA